MEAPGNAGKQAEQLRVLGYVVGLAPPPQLIKNSQEIIQIRALLLKKKRTGGKVYSGWYLLEFTDSACNKVVTEAVELVFLVKKERIARGGDIRKSPVLRKKVMRTHRGGPGAG